MLLSDKVDEHFNFSLNPKRYLNVCLNLGKSDNVVFYHYLGYLLLTKSTPLELFTHLILTFTFCLWINTIWVT